VGSIDITGLRRFIDWKAYPASAWVLIGSNILAPLAAIAFGADPAGIVWAYWLESVVIGIFTVLTFLTIACRSFSASRWGEGLAAGGNAAFFSLHFGLFHAVYALFLSILPWFRPDMSDAAGIGLAALILSGSHGYSFLKNILRNDKELENTKENRGRIMMAPYGRIVPMHITIIVSGFIMFPLMPFLMLAQAAGASPAVVLFVWAAKFAVMCVFVGLKTIADIFGHLMRYGKSDAPA
jgi:hypothetical protein